MQAPTALSPTGRPEGDAMARWSGRDRRQLLRLPERLAGDLAAEEGVPATQRQ